MHHSDPEFSSRTVFRGVLGLAILSALFLALGCGNDSTHFVAPTPTPLATTSTQIRIGDSPVDQLLAFEVTVGDPVVAKLASGKQFNVTLSNNRLELSHMAGKMEPILVSNLPQGSYSGLEITFVDPAVTYVYQRGWFFDGGRSSIATRDFPGSQTVKIEFNPAVTLGSNASVVSIDVDLAKALVMNPDDSSEITGVNFTPEVFTITQTAPAPSDKQQHDDGELESVMGTVASVNGNSFTLNAGQSGAVLTVTTTGATKFYDSVKDLADMVNRLVEVEGYTQSDGTLVATEVEGLVSSKGASIEGVILDAGDSLIERNVLGYAHQAQSFTILAQDATGNGTKNDDLGWTFTVHTDYLTENAYSVDYGKCDWKGLGTDVPGPLFPFDSTHLFPGQRVSVATGSALPDADFSHFTATSVELEQQAVTGQIVFYHPPNPEPTPSLAVTPADQGTWFVLYLPEDSFVRSLSGRTFVLVYQGPATDVEFLPTNEEHTIGVGTVARVRGLMFAFASWYPNSAPAMVSMDGGTLTMIARRVTEMAPEKKLPPSLLKK
jgi:Domain of unknown function (DUF5666)